MIYTINEISQTGGDGALLKGKKVHQVKTAPTGMARAHRHGTYEMFSLSPFIYFIFIYAVSVIIINKGYNDPSEARRRKG